MAAKAPPNPKPKLEFTPDQVALIEKMGKEKATRKEMAAALGISVTSLRRHFRAQLGTRAPTVPQPKIIWTEAHRELVGGLAGMGCSMNELGRMLGTTKELIARDFQDEIDTATSIVNTQVASALFKNCLAGNVSAQIYWLRSRAGWDQGDPRSRRSPGFDPDAPEVTEEITPEATRANIREAAKHLSRHGRRSLRDVVDDLAAASARVVNP